MRKSIISIILFSFIALSFISCDMAEVTQSADRVQTKQTEKALSEAQSQIGMPNIVNFQQRKLMKLIYEMCDKEDLVCFAYTKNEYKGTLVFVGKCIGFGIPFSAQFTNPMKVIDTEKLGISKYQASGEIQVIPQADPNGLFMPTSSSATWLMMIDPNTNKPRPVYFEPEIVISPFPLF